MQPQDNRNMIIAIVLSIIVLFGWQFFIANPQMEQAQQRAQVEAQRQADNALATPAADGATPAVAGATGAQAFVDRAAAIAASARVPILTESLTGSISLTGGRLDDLELNKYHETVDPTSPKVTLFTPAGAPNAFFAEQGWVPAGGGASAVPDNAVWTLDGANTTLTETTPVTIRYETSTGLVFRRTFTVDNNYLFTVKQTVQNTGTSAVSLFPFSRIARHDTPRTSHFFILQEGPYGVLGSENLVELARRAKIPATSLPARRLNRSSTATRSLRFRPAGTADRLGLVPLHHQADVLPDPRSSTASWAISASPSWP
jgi:YidC/Oxa1 family membrane protein insertase